MNVEVGLVFGEGRRREEPSLHVGPRYSCSGTTVQVIRDTRKITIGHMGSSIRLQNFHQLATGFVDDWTKSLSSIGL